MGTHKESKVLHAILLESLVITLFYGVCVPSKALAFDWRMRPSLSMTEMFSDNLALSDNAKKSGFVTEVAPGVSLYGSSPWSNFNLNYRLQSLYNAGGRDAIDVNHQLQMKSLYQAVRNTLFLESSSSISQQNVNNSVIATDNLTGNSGSIENRNFNISPYWTPHFGQYASGLLKIGYQHSTFDNANNSGNSQDTTSSSIFISDSETITKQARLASGSKFNKVKWNVNYSSQDQSRTTGDDVLFEQYQGEARYFYNRKYNVFVQGGYENNDYQTTNDNIKNGFFYTVGGQWSPSRFYSIEAGYGNNKHVTLHYSPSANLTSTITYRNKDVGLNTGSSWDANLNYRVQQARIGFNYSQETTTVQQELAEQSIFYLTDSFGNTVIDPVTQQPQQFIINSPNPVDDVIISKQARLTFNYQSGKSSYNAAVYNTRRTYELSSQEDNVYGASAGWQWQFAPRLNFFLRPTWQSSDITGSTNSVSNTSGSGYDRYDVALGLTRSVPINLGRPLLMNTSLEFRHIDQVSDANGYTENRATANFAVRF
ncbi:TIGR03016 family PEP-CTERM system-associated outer membrane protein [Methylomonas sp. LL1]|nr:TIGR03016 family PEP-CTERM system-associated outer membrane protein [Methylomonas sp. LL1]